MRVVAIVQWLVISGLISLLIVGCRGSKPVVITERETVTITEILRDTVVTVEPDASMMRALLECDENRNVVVRELLEWQSGKHIQPPQVIIRDNVMTVVAEVDSFAIFINWKEREKLIENVQTVTVETNLLTGWQWFQIWAGRIAMMIIVIILIFRILTVRRAGK